MLQVKMKKKNKKNEDDATQLQSFNTTCPQDFYKNLQKNPRGHNMKENADKIRA